MEDSFIIANRTDVGKVREVNEDSMVTFDSPNGRVVAVCDGMGGQAAGDVASRLACDIISDILMNNKFDSPSEAITRACMAANQAIVHKASQNPNMEGMGATCVMVIIKDGLVYYGWVGDSRIYYISKGNIRQLSKDQSYVQLLVDKGEITAAEAEHHPQKNQILNALGLANMTPPELCTAPLSPEPDSVILLCSDGLSGMVDNQQILAVVSSPNMSLQRKADKLVDLALVNGGNDNITVQLIHFAKESKEIAIPQNQKNNGNNLGMWALIAAAAVIVVILFFWIFSGNDNPEPGPVMGSSNTEQSGAQQAKEPTKVVTTEKNTTIVEKEKNKPNNSLPSPKDQTTKDNKSNDKNGPSEGNSTFGEQKQGDAAASEKINSTKKTEKPTNESSSTLDELIKKDK